MNVDQIMSIAVKTCRPRDTLQQIAQSMWEHDFGAMPVVNEAGEPIAMITDRRLPVVGCRGEVVGMLSLNDIATHAHRKHSALHRDELGAEAIASTLGAICARPKTAQAAE